MASEPTSGAATAQAAGPQATDQLIIREFQPGDEVALNSLFNRVFKLDRPLDEWRWKFAGNRAAAAMQQLVINVAEIDGSVVGHFASLIFRFKFFGDEVVLGQSVDTAVDPPYRGGGRTIVRLTQAHERLLAERGLLFGYGTPNPQHYAVGKLFLRYQDLCVLLTLRRRLNWRHTLRRLAPWLPEALVRAAGLGAVALGRIGLHWPWRSGLVIRRVGRFDAAADALWQRARERYGILAVRDSRFLNWRYADRPGSPYVILQAEVDARLAGFIVLHMKYAGGDAVGQVMDLFAESNPAVEQALLQRALAWFRAAGADYAVCQVVAQGPDAAIFRAAGFREHDSFAPMQVIYAPHEQALRKYPDLADPQQWHLGIGDFDAA